jgi:phosphoribosyl-ATP pyrophosphohydrolase
MHMKSFNSLYLELEKISKDMPAGSNSARLLTEGVHSIGKKVVEEAAEVWMAAEYQSNQDLALEASQLIYHLQLLLVAKGIPLSDLEERL